MYYLGIYYSKIEINEELMIKYYKMAFDHGCSDVIFDMAIYYDNIGDYENMLNSWR